jgi:putative lipoprotein
MGRVDKLRRLSTLLVICASILVWSGRTKGQGTDPKPVVYLTGTVSYLEKMLLPRNAELKFELEDESDREHSRVVFVRMIPTDGRQVPISFSLPLPPGTIDANSLYALRGSILINGKVWFKSRNDVLVLTHGHADFVRMVLDRSS